MTADSYQAVMATRGEIMQRSIGLDYNRYARGAIAFDYEGLFKDTGYDLDTARAVQARTAVGNTPLLELSNITALARAVAPPGKGARIFVTNLALTGSGCLGGRGLCSHSAQVVCSLRSSRRAGCCHAWAQEA